MKNSSENTSKKIKLLSPHFLAHWNNGADSLEQYGQTNEWEEKLRFLESAEFHFTSAKMHCDSVTDIQSCNQQLILLSDQKISVHFLNVMRSRCFNFLEMSSVINKIIDDIQSFLEESPETDAAFIWSAFYYNLGAECFNIIPLFKDDGADVYEQFGRLYKQYLEQARITIPTACQNLMAKISYSTSTLMREDLVAEMNTSLALRYVFWLNYALNSYVKNRSLYPKDELMVLVDYAMELHAHPSMRTVGENSEFVKFTRLLLSISRNSEKKEVAMAWKRKYDVQVSGFVQEPVAPMHSQNGWVISSSLFLPANRSTASLQLCNLDNTSFLFPKFNN